MSAYATAPAWRHTPHSPGPFSRSAARILPDQFHCDIVRRLANDTNMRTADFDYVLPPELIAQQPTPRRDQSRLLVLNRWNGEIAHRQFRDLLEYLREGDVLVLNNSRVIPARLRGINARTGGEFGIVLLEEKSPN